MWKARGRIDNKKVRITRPGSPVGADRGRHLFFNNQGAIEPRRRAGTEQHIDQVKNVIIPRRQGRFVVGNGKGRLGIEPDRHPLFSFLRRLDRRHRRHRGAARNIAEILPDGRHRPGKIDVADQADDRVNRRVVGLQEIPGLGQRQVDDVGAPADDRVAVGMHGKSVGDQVLIQHATRIALVGTPPFFQDDVPLGVEFAQDRVLHPVRLDRRPEFQLVGRQGDEVGRLVLAGKGIVAGAAVLGINT